jgi:hypothetical protein
VTSEQTAFLVRAAKFVIVVLFAYAVASLAAAFGLGVFAGTYDKTHPFGFALLVGMFAFPFVLVSKWVMYVNGLDGVFPHAIAGLVVGGVAGVLIAEARQPHWIASFALAGMCGALAYLGARNLGRKVVRW